MRASLGRGSRRGLDWTAEPPEYDRSMLQRVTIGGRVVAAGEPCFVIAEAGVNHNGELELAKKLVDAAAEAGADAVKFQTWQTEKLVARDAPLAAYQEAAVGGTSQFDMLKRLELTYDAFAELQAYAQERGI